MTIPPTAVVWKDVMDPADKLDWVMDLQPYLEAAEGIQTFAIVLSAEAVAAGLSISTGGSPAKDPKLINTNTQILLWFEVNPADLTDPMFDGAGTSLAMTVTFNTDAIISRQHQITYVLKVAQK